MARTTPGKTLFSLSYGYEAMVLVEMGMSSLRRENYDQNDNHILQRHELDYLEEKWSASQLRVVAYQHRTTRYFNSKVKPRIFQVGNLVLRLVIQNKGALDSNWEGLYKIA